MSLLAGKNAIVTGADRSIGRGIALTLAVVGASVYVTGRCVDAADETTPGAIGAIAAEVDARGERGIAVQVDHGDDPQVATSGGTFISSELAAHYGIVEINRQAVPSLRAERGAKIWDPI